MRILIVDDDIPTVEVVQSSIPWQALGIDQVLTAYDFAEAQNKIRQTDPDIVLCDIEMPKGSGLDLLKWLREENRSSEFIFLTCHANFDYAKTAIQYGAADYITKPFNIAETENVLRRVVTRMQYQSQQLLAQQAGEAWEDERQLAQAGFFHQLLFEGTQMDSSALQKRFDSLGISYRADSPCYLVLAAIPANQVAPEWKPELFGYGFRNLAAELMGNLDQTRAFVYFHYDTHYCVLWFPGESDRIAAAAACRALCEACRKHVHCEATCYLSEPVYFREFSALREKLEQFDRRNVSHRGEVLLPDDTHTPTPEAEYRLEVKKLEPLFHQGNVAGIAQLVAARLQALARQEQLTPTVMHQLHHDVLQLIYTVLAQNGIAAHDLFNDAVSGELGRNAERSVMDMTKWVSFAANRTVQIIKESRKEQSVSGRMVQYIHAHYAQHIGNSEVAASVYLSPDYANRIFKEEQGLSIKDYLNQYRMEQAKRLLLQPSSNVSDVAAEVGLDSFSYFSTLFRKYTGYSPSEFRKKNLA